MFRLSVPTVETELVGERDQVVVPFGVSNLTSFRLWTASEQFPLAGRISYLAGTIWVDLSMEQAYSHNQIKSAVTATLKPLTQSLQSGRYFGDGMRLINGPADLDTVPDGLFVSFEAIESGAVRQVAGRSAGVTEFEGAPDMVLEVVSDSSVEKDTGQLPELYARSGISEFWRIDAREGLRFEILRLVADVYVASVAANGWLRSEVFGRSFRFVQTTDRLGQPDYILEVRT
jgi:Uma2 family endonuclease